MKLLRPWMIEPLASASAAVLKLWMGSLRYDYHSIGRPMDPFHLERGERAIYAFWHETMLVPCNVYGCTGARVLISKSDDGRFIAAVARRFGMKAVFGSSARKANSVQRSTRGGAEALLQLVREARDGHIVVTPDGPLGPRRRVKPGSLYLAAKTGLPIIPTGFGYDHPWRLKTWDRFIMPRPGTRVVGLTGEPIHVPRHLDDAQLEQLQGRLEDSLNNLMAEAERLLQERQRRVAA